MQNKRWILAIVSMFSAAFFCSFSLKFNLSIAWGVTIISAGILIGLGERMVSYTTGKTSNSVHILWGICTVIYLILIVLSIEQGQSLAVGENHNGLARELQVGILLSIDYILVIGIYRKVFGEAIRENVTKWIPNLWYLVIGIGTILYIKQRNDYMLRGIILGIIGLVLITYLLFKHFVSRDEKIIYHISVGQYLITFVICLTLVIGIGICIPEIQELPGTRWLKKVASAWNTNVNWSTKVPVRTYLSNEFPLSEAILFEVNASEPLYLREMAYNHYEDGAWSIEPNQYNNESYVVLKPQYLQAEYLQTQSLLDEMIYQNSQNPELFSKYVKIANYESSVTNKKKYTIVQNPINKINYFTVNGMLDIKDEATTKVYYYKNINTCYFHGDIVMEPSNYTVEYYDHIPKKGSREYTFLRNMNCATWSILYKQIIENRDKYQYEYSDLPKLLLTYTPMVQYKNAQKNFLQVPKELKKSLEPLARSIILSQKSDWERAELICTYLKSQYTYNLHSKYSEEEDRIYSFLFKEKEGICQEFASSMVLLCRSIGIPAKYVTGYLVTEKNPDTGNYIVREKDAHAFVEVYIAGYGWMTFDPTPTRVVEDMKLTETTSWSRNDYIKGISISLFIGVLFIISKGGIFYLRELRLKVILLICKPQKQLVELMKHTVIYLEKQGYPRKTSETLTQYANQLKVHEIDITKLVKIYEAYIYGNKKIESKEVKEGYQTYKGIKLKNK